LLFLGTNTHDSSQYRELRAAVIEAGYEHDIDWAQTVKAPATPADFAREVIWVILCSGMKEQVARIIQSRVWATITAGKPVKGNVLGKAAKRPAIDTIWRDRYELFLAFQMASDKVNLPIPCRGSVTSRNGTLPRTSGLIAPNRIFTSSASRCIIKRRQMPSAPISRPQPATASQQSMLLSGEPAILVS